MMRECRWCGDSIPPESASHTYCSKTCANAFYNAQKRGDSLCIDAPMKPYGEHEFDGLVASWLRSAPILGSTLIGA